MEFRTMTPIWEAGTMIVEASLKIMKEYLKNAEEYVDLESELNLYEYKGKTINLKQAIEILIKDFERVLDDDFERNEEEFELFAKVIPALWY